MNIFRIFVLSFFASSLIFAMEKEVSLKMLPEKIAVIRNFNVYISNSFGFIEGGLPIYNFRTDNFQNCLRSLDTPYDQSNYQVNYRMALIDQLNQLIDNNTLNECMNTAIAYLCCPYFRQDDALINLFAYDCALTNDKIGAVRFNVFLKELWSCSVDSVSEEGPKRINTVYKPVLQKIMNYKKLHQKQELIYGDSLLTLSVDEWKDLEKCLLPYNIILSCIFKGEKHIKVIPRDPYVGVFFERAEINISLK